MAGNYYLRIKIGDWKKDWNGYYISCADLEVTARDMAKFGLLYLNRGEYRGQQIIRSGWVNESLQKYSDNINSAGIKSSRAARYFYDIGQFIILLHDLDMIIVVTSDPFIGKENHFNAWQYEKSNINLVGKFIKSLPKGN